MTPLESNTSDSVPSIFRRGSILFFSTSETYPSNNKTVYLEAKRALHVFIMSFKYDGNGSTAERGENTGATVLCGIVSKDPKDESAAVHWRLSTMAVLGMVMLSTLAIVW
jgi:hypothetical protein